MKYKSHQWFHGAVVSLCVGLRARPWKVQADLGSGTGSVNMIEHTED